MLKYRLVSGLLLGGMALGAAFFLPSPGCWLLVVVIAALGQHEFYRMLETAGIKVRRRLGMVCGALLVSTVYGCLAVPAFRSANVLPYAEHGVFFLIMLIVFLRQFPDDKDARPVTTIACTLLGVWYAAYLTSFFLRLGFQWHEGGLGAPVGGTGGMLVFYLVAVVKVSDIGAYFSGRFLGRHKLYPRLSPKKTVEGLVGGILSSLVVSLLFAFVLEERMGDLSLRWIDAIILGLLLPCVGVLGDLFESLVKRSCHVKDSGTLIPGMGGVLDVLDSLLLGAPVLYVYATLFMLN